MTTTTTRPRRVSLEDVVGVVTFELCAQFAGGRPMADADTPTIMALLARVADSLDGHFDAPSMDTIHDVWITGAYDRNVDRLVTDVQLHLLPRPDR